MSFKFDNNTNEIIKQLQGKAIQFLHEAGGEIHTQVVRNIDRHTDQGQLKSSWKYNVDESNLKVTIGSPLENALWEEFGTGSYAEDGRRTPWYIPVDNYKGRKKPSYQGKVVIVYGKDGKAFYKTDGKEPRRHLQKAWESKIPVCKKRLKQLISEVGK